MTRRSPSIERIGEWVDRLEAENLATQERMLIRGGPKPYASSGSAGNWGGAKPRIKELREEYDELVCDTGLRLRSNALLGLLPHVESVRGVVRASSGVSRGPPVSMTCCSGRVTCCATAVRHATTSAGVFGLC